MAIVRTKGLKSYLTSALNGEVVIPKLQSFLLREIEDSPNGKPPKASIIQDCDLTIKTFQERKKEYNHGDANEDERTKHYFHPSQAGACLRAMWYGSWKAPQPLPDSAKLLKDYLRFEIGTYFHVLFQNLLERAGVLESREFLACDHQKKIIGHADGILSLPQRVLLEIKTINNRGFDELKGSPKTEHKMQVELYMDVLGLDETLFVYYNKDSSEVAAFRYQRDENFLNSVVLPRVAIYHKTRGTLDAPERGGKSLTKMPCSFCPYAGMCWNTAYHQNFVSQCASKQSRAQASKQKLLVQPKKVTLRLR